MECSRCTSEGKVVVEILKWRIKMIKEETKPRAFTLPNQNGEMRSLADYQGLKVILYFYSKDMTAGCTKQACAFGELE